MEVEVKLRLPDSEAYKTLISLLSPFHIKTHNQHNNFFDGVDGQLSVHRAVLRLRFYNDQPATKCIICLKAKAVLVDGVSRVEEDEEELDPSIGQECLAEPNRLGSLVESSRIMKRVNNEFFGESNNNDGLGLGFVCLGGFKNLRNVYEWNGLMIEVDETSFDFGTLYEIEGVFGSAVERCLLTYCVLPEKRSLECLDEGKKKRAYDFFPPVKRSF